MSSLDQPESPSDLYQARGSEVTPHRPLLTGDVFESVTIPGVDDGAGLGMLLAHPCSMRRGAHVRDVLQVARVEAGPAITMWDGNYGAMPLPELLAPGDFRLRATFELAGRVRAVNLPLGRRVACLSSQGIVLLLQRLAFSQTRVAVDLDTLHEAIAHVLEEADLLEDWLTTRCADAADPSAAMPVEEERFEAVMSGMVSGKTRRQRLLDPKERAAVRRMVREAMRDA